MQKLARISAAVILGASLTSGLAAAQQATVDTTGPDSDVSISAESVMDSSVDNNTDLSATNNNPQDASTGDVEVDRNTSGGDAMSGEAANDAELMVGASVDNSSSHSTSSSSSSMAGQEIEISNTGPESSVEVDYVVETTHEVNNNTAISITNNSSQSARSGEARVSGNTTGGDARSGDAMNTSSVELMFDVMN